MSDPNKTQAKYITDRVIVPQGTSLLPPPQGVVVLIAYHDTSGEGPELVWDIHEPLALVAKSQYEITRVHSYRGEDRPVRHYCVPCDDREDWNQESGTTVYALVFIDPFEGYITDTDDYYELKADNEIIQVCKREDVQQVVSRMKDRGV